MSVRVRVDDRAVKAYFRRVLKRNTTFVSVLESARKSLGEANAANFARKGTLAGSPWAPLDDDYRRWKRAEFPGRPLMVRSGALLEDLSTLTGPPNLIERTRATFGTDIDYAKFHQTGTTNMAQRKIVFVPSRFGEEVGARAADYLVNDTSIRRARSLFR